MGHIRRGRCPDPILTSRCRGSHIRHFSSLLLDSYPPRPAACALHILGRYGVYRSGSHVWAGIKCRCLRIHHRHAHRHLQACGLFPHHQMGGRFSGHSPSWKFLDRRGFYEPGLPRLGSHGAQQSSAVLHPTNVTLALTGISPPSRFLCLPKSFLLFRNSSHHGKCLRPCS